MRLMQGLMVDSSSAILAMLLEYIGKYVDSRLIQVNLKEDFGLPAKLTEN